MRVDVDSAREERRRIIIVLERLSGEVRDLSARVGDPPNPLEGYEGSGLQRAIYRAAYDGEVTIPHGRSSVVLLSRRKVAAGVVTGVAAIVVALGQALAPLVLP